MLRKTLIAVVALAILVAAAPNVGAASDNETTSTLEFLTAVLKDAREKGALSDQVIEVLSDWLIEEVARDAGEIPNETRKRLSLGVATWEAPFDFLLITVEEAYSAEIIGDELSERLSDLIIEYLISPASGETRDEVRERLSADLASGAERISDEYGTLSNPAPFRERAITDDGAAITVLASNLDATDIVQGWSELNTPPDSGNKYVIIRVRLEDSRDSGDGLSHSFGLIGASGRLISLYGEDEDCQWTPPGDSYEFRHKVIHGGFRLYPGDTRDGVLCYQAPIEEEDIFLFLNRADHWSSWIDGFWAVSADSPRPETLIAPPTISDDYGSPTNPVPIGEGALAQDGIAITILSANLDATQHIKESNKDRYQPPSEGNKYVTVRIRIADMTGVEGYEDEYRGVYLRDFGIVSSSGRISPGSSRSDCRSTTNVIGHIQILKGGWTEDVLCFEIASDEIATTLYYKTWVSYKKFQTGFWDISSGGYPLVSREAPLAISDTYGTLTDPVPAGESALASDGISIAVLSIGGGVNRWGGKRVKVYSRIEYFGEEEIRILNAGDFGLVSSSGLITYGDIHYSGCSEHIQDPDAEIIPGGWQEYEVCFQAPVEDDPGLTLFYLPDGTDQILGFWAVSPNFAPRSVEAPTPITGTYGTLDNPVPAGEKGVASNDVVVSVTSAIIDATLLGYESSDTHKSVVIQTRVESLDQDRDIIRKASEGDFGIVGVSGTLSPENVKSECHWYDELGVRVFRGGWQEVNLCFTVPTSEIERLSIYYQPKGVDRPLGFWALPPTPAPLGIPAISDTYGTSLNPVPLGERALVSGGIAISVVPVDMDVTQGSGSSSSLLSPASGMEYAIVRLRVENHTGYGSAIKHSHVEILDGSRNSIVVQPDDFGLIGPSGQALSRSNSFWGCEMEPDEFYAELPMNGSVEANLCFRISVEDTEGLVLYYNPFNTNRVMGFWSLSENAPQREPRNPAKPISDDYGTRASPVPVGENALASNGHAISVLSTNLDATDEETDNQTKSLLIRVENHSASENWIPEVNSTDFGMITSSGMASYKWLSGCAFRPESVEGYIVFRDVVFRGGFIERSLCYQIPKDEIGLTLFYRPDDSVLGFWEVSEATSTPAPLPRPMKISDAHGTWMNPVPLGEKALASDGIAISLAAVPDIDQIIEDSGEYYPPASPGKKYFVVCARIENFSEDEADELARVFHTQFSLLTESSDLITSDDLGCGYEYNSPVIRVYPFPDQLENAYLFKDGWAEGYLCFQVPVNDTVQSVLYRQAVYPYGSYWNQTGPVLGFWAVSEDTPTYMPSEPGTPISDSYGRYGSLVPAGEKAVASDGIAVTIVSANLDAKAEFPSAPEPGNKYILVRIRAENTSGRWNEIRELGTRDFGIKLSSGLLRNLRDLYNPNPALCDWVEIPDQFEARIFGGMSYEGNLCFQIPVDEATPAIFYIPSDTDDVPAPPALHAPYDPDVLNPYVLGYWALPEE